MSQTEKSKKPVIVAQIMGKWIGGGVESVIMNYYRHLDHKKIQFDFICDEDSTRIPYEEIKKLGGRVFLVPKYQKLPQYLKALEDLFRKNQYRIVHSNINTLSVFPLYAAKKAGVPVRISHSHSTSNTKEWKRNIIKNILRPFSKKYATDYFACSELAGQYLFGNKAFDQGEVKIIHNAIDLDKFKFDPEVRKKLRKELDIDEKTIVIGHVGRFVKQKNHDFLIDVFNEYHAKNPDSKLLLIGTGPLEEKIKAKVEKLNLSDYVLFLGQREDTNKLYSVMDVFCLPSLYEGLGMVLIEAQTNGLPCVASDKVPKEAKVSENISFSPFNVEKFTKKINTNRDSINTFFPTEYNILKNAPKLQKIYGKYKESNQKIIKVLQLGMTDNLGGIETFLINHYENIDRSKIKFDFINIYKNSLYNQQSLEILGCKIYRVKSYYVNPLSYLRQVINIINKNNYTVIHCNMNSAAMIFPLIAGKLSRTKTVICHAHNASSDKGLTKELLHNINKLFIPYLANIYFSCSNKASMWFYSKKIRKSSKHFIIYNAVNAEKFKYDKISRQKNRKSYNINDTDLVIGNIGRFSKQKNQIWLLNTFEEKLRKNKLKLILVGKGENLENIKNIIKEKKLENNIITPGLVTDIENIFNMLDIFIMPSLYEGLPNTAIEAQYNGVPTLLSDTITDEAIIRSNSLRFPLNTDRNKLWDDIKKLKRSNDESTQLNNYNNFDIKKSSLRIGLIYEKITQNE